MMTKEDAILISNGILLTKFPELKSQRINYRFVAGKKYDFYMAIRPLVFKYQIYIEKQILEFSVEAFSGCMAHEFAHIVLDMRKTHIRDFWEFLIRSRNKIDVERKADTLVIERGLGNELLKFHQEHGKEHKAYNTTEGLTKGEIKRLLKIKQQ